MKRLLYSMLATASVATVTAQQQKNVVIIMADDMGAMELGCYGGKVNDTPFLNKMAEQGAMFNSFLATPVSSPSRVALMTGKRGFKTGWLNMKGRDAGGAGRDSDLAKDEYTFGQIFKDAGYGTAFAGKWQLTGSLPTMITECGFDQYMSWIYTGYLPKGEKYLGGFYPEGSKSTSRFWQPGIAVNGKHIATKPTDYGPDMFSDFLAQFMEKSVKDKKPFFAYYPMVLMHTPWIGTPDHPNLKLNSPEARKANAEYTDKMVGKLLKKLDDLGIRENTIVFFLGDNGTQGVGKSSVTEWGPRTPLIVSCPGTIKPAVYNQPVEITDVTVTALDYANVKPKNHKDLDGISLMPMLTGKSKKHRDYAMSYYGQYKILREEKWLLEANSVDNFGDLYYCGDKKSGLGYQLITDYKNNKEAQAAKKRFEGYLATLPTPDISKDLRDEFTLFVENKKQTLLKSLKEEHNENYGGVSYEEASKNAQELRVQKRESSGKEGKELSEKDLEKRRLKRELKKAEMDIAPAATQTTKKATKKQ
ncbi:MAG: sulfatase-like hydrolase/transferase [Paludibacter sp.]|nr:sulfatase-like hydrolase/transferase [Paludibacter sp.]